MTSEAQGRKVLKALESAFPGRRERPPRDSLVYLDTFDWRLFDHGLNLALRCLNGITALSLESDDNAVEERLSRSTAPRFAWELPAGRLRDLVAPITDVRRLLPLARVDSKAHGLRILDEQEKTVARVHLVRASVAIPDAETGGASLGLRLRVIPVRGYPAASRRVTQYIEQQLRLSPRPGGTFEEALEMVGQRPGDYSSKLELRLQPEMLAGEAAVVVCRQLLDMIVANEEGVRRDLDSEFLHDFRVAARRTRSALSNVGKVFAPDALEHFRREFKWLGSVTSPVRDLDVYLLQMDEYRTSLPEAVGKDLAPLSQYLRRHRSAGRRRLLAAMRSKRYRQLVAQWRDYLDGPLPERSAAPLAQRPALEVACKRIWRAYRKVDKNGRAIAPDTPAKALHSLRIDCKKLRYLLEFFYSLFDADDIGPLVKALKQLQDNLGEFNDLEVQKRTLQRFAHEMDEEGLTSVDSLLAMGRLLDHHDQRQRKERQRFARCFARFDDPGNQERFQRLFESPAGDRP